MYILSKHRELSKQINIHEIAENFRRNLASNPFSFFFSFFENKREKQQKHATQEKKNLFQACKVRANLTSRREVYLYQDRKAAAQHAFSVIPIKYQHGFSVIPNLPCVYVNNV
jgi:uncharacterized protein (DUF169 family)